MGISREVIERAAGQGGLVTRAQLLAMGHSSGSIDWWVKSDAVVVVGAGVYRVVPPADHQDLVRGAILALPNAVASHQSAAHLLHLPRLPRLEPTVSVASRTTHRFPGVTVRRCDDLRPSHLTRVGDIPVTGSARTLFDLAGVLPFTEFDLIAEAAIVHGRVKLDQFERVSNSLARRGKRGSRSAHDFLEMRSTGDPKATRLESKGRAVLSAAGLPDPIPQFPMPWNPTRRFDDAYPHASLALEWDSKTWHGQRAAMRSDRVRDREAAVHGWSVVRFTWEDVTEHPREVASTVARLLQLRTPPS
ncbi:MAG: hypothetical protein WAL25_12570 [Acidimicrobiia bacterium]